MEKIDVKPTIEEKELIVRSEISESKDEPPKNWIWEVK